METNCYNVWSVVLTIISIIATLAVSGTTIWLNIRYKKLADQKDKARENEIKEENRLKIRPYIFADFLDKDFTYFENKSNVEFLYFDDLPSNKKAIEIHYRLFPDIMGALSNQDSIASTLKAQKLIRKYKVIAYKVRNVGAASAINVSLFVNNAVTLPPFALMVGEIKEIILLFDFDEIKKLDEYEIILDFRFTDVEGNESYSQSTSFFINKDINALDLSEYYTSSQCEITPPKRINLEKKD